MPDFPKLNLPDYEFKIIEEGDSLKIYDVIRKKYLVLTPEEWVRQNFLRFLFEEKKYPRGLTKLEMAFGLHNVNKRCDAIIYNTQNMPLVLVECKAPHVKITQDTFNQIGYYNSELKVKYLIVTNGLEHYCCLMDYQTKKIEFLDDIPSYPEIK